jgi:hypothetical protein
VKIFTAEEVTGDWAGHCHDGTKCDKVLAMAEAYRCSVCDKTEEHCDCDKYCCLCQGEHQVRLCNDGLYYCLECRESCDLQAQ